jgi:hypothetical protein
MPRRGPIGIWASRACIGLGSLVTLGLPALGLTGCQQTAVFEPEDGGSGGGGGNGPAGCLGGQPVYATPEWPVVIVALDRGSSMEDPFGPPGSQTKLLAAQQALLNVVSKYDSVVQFGYVGFPGKATGGCSPESCCSAIDWTTFTSPGPGGAKAVENWLSGCDDPSSTCAVGSDKPTAAALQACQTSFANATANEWVERAVLLVTDGDPGCAGGSGDPCRDAQRAVSNLQTSAGAATNVVGLGPPSSDGCLTKLVNFGSGTYSAVHLAELENTLNGIVRQVAKAACRLDPDPHSPPLDPAHLRISLQIGMDVAPNNTNGWSVERSQLVLNGKACEDFIDSGLTAPILSECPGP